MIHRCMVFVCGKEAPSSRTIYRWFANFSSWMESADKYVTTGQRATSNAAGPWSGSNPSWKKPRRSLKTKNNWQQSSGISMNIINLNWHCPHVWLEPGHIVNSNRANGHVTCFCSTIHAPHQPEHPRHSRCVGLHCVSLPSVLFRSGSLGLHLLWTR